MIQILYDQSLKPFNTFGMDVPARRFFELNSETQLREFLADEALCRQPLIVLGGGSNILFTGAVSALVVKINLPGKEILSQDAGTALVRAAAGENWDEFVAWTLDHGLFGLENLSLIPGQVGSSPIQNIGAYGVEVKDSIKEVEVRYLADGRKEILQKEQCRFGYRDSIFKSELKGQVIIVSVTFRLSKSPELHLAYGAISRELAEMGILQPKSADVRDAVCRIRRSKLPDPAVLGNAGSFFKNPTVSEEIHKALVAKYDHLPAYPQADGSFKLAAGWLIEQCGWKGACRGDAGVHEAQALVLVNYGNATGNELLALANEIRESVRAKFGVELEMEVNIR